MEFTNSSKSRELLATVAVTVAQDKAPEPLVVNRWFDEPSAEGQVYVTPFKVVVPDMLAVPPTSNLVLVAPPALMPKLPVVISKPVDEDAPPEMVIRPSVVRVPMPERLPPADMSQSLVLISPVSPLSPKMNLPAVWKLPEMLALPSKKTLPSTSRAPAIKRSLVVSISVLVAVATPNLLYAALANPPTCRVLPVKREDAEAVPWTSELMNKPLPETSSFAKGVVVPIPTLPPLVKLTLSPLKYNRKSVVFAGR